MKNTSKLGLAIAALTFGALALAATTPGSSAQKPGSSQGGAQQQSGQQAGQQRGGHRGPPPEAIAACAGMAEQATCTFNGRNGEALAGVCMGPPPGAQAPKDAPLACRPNNMPPPDGGQGGEHPDGPPPQQ